MWVSGFPNIALHCVRLSEKVDRLALGDA